MSSQDLLNVFFIFETSSHYISIIGVFYFIDLCCLEYYILLHPGVFKSITLSWNLLLRWATIVVEFAGPGEHFNKLGFVDKL